MQVEPSTDSHTMHSALFHPAANTQRGANSPDKLGQKNNIQFIHAQVPVLDSALLGSALGPLHSSVASVMGMVGGWTLVQETVQDTKETVL